MIILTNAVADIYLFASSNVSSPQLMIFTSKKKKRKKKNKFLTPFNTRNNL